MQRVPWERTAAGRTVVRADIVPLLPTPATLKRLAMLKLLDVTLISAEFGGVSLVFEPWIWLFVEEAKRALFCGVFRSAYPVDPADVHAVPDACWRMAEWDLDRDLS